MVQDSGHDEPAWHDQLTPSEAVEAVAARCIELSEEVDAGRMPRATLDHWLAEWAEAVRRAAGPAAVEPPPPTAPAERPPVGVPPYSLPPVGSNAAAREKV